VRARDPLAERWAAFLWRRRWIAAVVALAITAVALPALRGVRVDNSLEVWMDHEGEPYQRYQEFLERFGSEEFILLIYTPPEPPTPIDLPFLERLTDLTLDLEDIAGVGDVQCLSRIYARFFALEGIEAFRRDLAASPFYRNFLLSADGRSAAVWMQLELHDPTARRRIVEAVEAVIATDPLGRPIALAGSPVINTALDRYSQRASRVFFPPVFLISGLLLWALYRRWRAVLLPFVVVGVGIAWTMALLTVTGHTLNLLTVALPPIVWVLGLSTSIHLLSKVQRLLGDGVEMEAAVRATLADLTRPCLFSAVTTALGFGSLAVAELAPVREMGTFAAFGVLACLASSLCLFPVLASFFLAPSRIPGERAGGWALAPPRFERHLARLACHHPLWVLAVAAVVTACLGVAVSKIQVESNVLKFFKADAPIAVTYQRLMDGFTGPYSLEVVVQPPEGVTLATLERLEALQAALAARPEVARVLSVVDLVKKGYQMGEGLPPETDRLPPDAAAFADTWQQLGERMPEERRQMVAGDVLRLSVLVRVMGSEDYTRLTRAIDDELVPFAAWQPQVTGIVRIVVDLQQRLLRSQIESFALAFAVIGLVMGLLLRSVRHALASLPTNLVPVLFALGVMGLLGIPLDPATMMIAGVALGVAVDDTIHFLAHYRQQRRCGVEREAAVKATLAAVGRPIALTSGVAAGGFFVLCLADFVPLIHFGLLTGVTLGAAFLADLLLLPALLVGVPRLLGRDR
jgi:predicted RND superfamily exporter protein